MIEYRVTHGGTIGSSWYTVDRRVDSAARDQWIPVPATGKKSTENPPRVNPGRFRFPDHRSALAAVRRQIAADVAAARRVGLGVTASTPTSIAPIATVTISR